MARILNTLNGLSNTLNAAFGGSAYESVSGRAWRQRAQPAWGRWQRFVDWLFFFDPGHCRRVHENETALYRRGPG